MNSTSRSSTSDSSNIMDASWAAPSTTRKRKRRRALERPPLIAHLQLDGRLTGSHGLLSANLFDELFPQLPRSSDETDVNTFNEAFIAVSIPNAATTRVDEILWAVVPVRRGADNQTQSVLRFPSASINLQPLVRIWQKSPSGAARTVFPPSCEIRILDIIPISLDSVFVSVDQRAVVGQSGLPSDLSNGSGRISTVAKKAMRQNELKSDHSSWEALQDIIRSSLQRQGLVHTGDFLASPRHSRVGHTLISIDLCQPTSQGVVTSNTKIVVLPAPSRKKSEADNRRFMMTNGIQEEGDDAEETANEQYHTAVEDASSSSAPETSAKSDPFDSSSNTETNASENDETSDTLSDDADGDAETIGLSLPALPSLGNPGFGFSSTTPRIGGLLSNGIASPGSVISTFSMSTVLGGGSRGKMFEACSLVAKISEEALHPKPSAQEDEEARIYVDTTSLQRLGCFSGDWIRIEAAGDGHLSTLGSWGLNSFENGDDEDESRCVRIYALPGSVSSRPRYAIDRLGHSRAGPAGGSFRKARLKAYLSPILLANLGNPAGIRVALLAPSQGRRFSKVLPTADRITNASAPPVARDVVLRKFSSPAGHDRQLDACIKWALSEYFTKKHRAIKSGDLIAIPFSETLGRVLGQGASSEEAVYHRDLMSHTHSSKGEHSGSDKMNVAWFKVGAVHSDEDSPDSPWGGLVVVRADITKLSQAGDEFGRLPSAMSNTWPYYFGIRKLSAASQGSVYPGLGNAPKPYISQTRRRLRELISIATSPQAIHSGLPTVAILLVSTQRHVGKATLAKSSCQDLGIHAFEIDAFDILSEGGTGGGDVKTAGLLEARASLGLVSGSNHTAIILRHVDILTADRMISSVRSILENSRVLIATTTQVDKVPESMRSLFTHELEIGAPDEKEREGLLKDITQTLGIAISADVDLAAVAVKTAALVAGDLVDVVERATVERQNRLLNLALNSSADFAGITIAASPRDVCVSGGEASRTVTKEDFDTAVEAARKNFADAIGAPKIPNVSWDDVGGLTHVKDAVMETIQLPLERPELFAKGMKKRSGILFYGPPGTGKTLLAKAIATEFSLNFFSVKGPELLNMYIGESEANVRRVFQRARDARPCVVFFDELDSVAPKRGNQGDSGGVMDRIVSQLLAELDGMSNGEEGGGGVFVIGATNRPDLLDQALLRPGRFDKMLYLGISDTHQKQLTILQALTRKFTLDPKLSLEAVANGLPMTYTGADLYALCSDSMLKAITRKSNAVDAAVRLQNTKRAQEVPPQDPISVAYYFDHLATPLDTTVIVEQSDFEAAQQELVPSVSAGELEHYERVWRTFESADSKSRKSPVGVLKAASDVPGLIDDTQRLSLENGTNIRENLARPPILKDKGKGKVKVMQDTRAQGGFGDAAAGDEDMYG